MVSYRYQVKYLRETMKDLNTGKDIKEMKFLIETGSESHTTSWQSMQAKFVGGSNDGKILYQNKPAIVSQEWLTPKTNAKVVKTVFDLPQGTKILIDYKGYEGPEKFIIELDESQEVQEIEVGTSRLRTYTVKGRCVLVRDLVKSAEDSLKASQEEGF